LICIQCFVHAQLDLANLRFPPVPARLNLWVEGSGAVILILNLERVPQGLRKLLD
jgi:hypothetical protein